jgi:hypothetical protein
VSDNASVNDETILDLARVIAAKDGVSLTSAMILAEEQLRPAPSLPESYTVTIKVKPRVSRWVQDVFGGHAKFSIEERLGAYLETHLNRIRIIERREAAQAPDIEKGAAVSMTRAQFLGKVGQ